MSQTDLNVANAPGATVRADINSHLDAIATLNSGATAPSTTFANQWWMDTANNILKQRDNANTAWINIASKVTTTWIPYSNGSVLGTAANVDTGTGSTAVPTNAQLEGTARTFTKPQRTTLNAEGNKTGSFSLDFSTYLDFDVTTTGDITIANPTSITAGQRGVIRVDNSAGHALTALGSYFKRIGSTTGAPTLGTGICRFEYHAVSATRIEYIYNDVEA